MSTQQQTSSAPTWLGWLQIAAGIFGIFVQALQSEQSGNPGNSATTINHVNTIQTGAHIVANSKPAGPTA